MLGRSLTSSLWLQITLFSGFVSYQMVRDAYDGMSELESTLACCLCLNYVNFHCLRFGINNIYQ